MTHGGVPAGAPFPPRPEVVGTVGVVSSTHQLATGAAVAMLDRGGNAFDAAVAGGFVLQVVEPHSNGLGGDLSAVLHDGATGSLHAVNGQGPTPQRATLAHFGSLGLGQVPGSGLLPACVPGAFGGWLRILAEFGSMPLAEILEPAIAYAERGFPLLAESAQTIAVLEPLFRHEWQGSGQVYLAGGIVPRAGDRLTNPALAKTLRRLACLTGRTGREATIEAALAAFYDGFVAEEIDAFVKGHVVLDGTGRRHRGLLTGDDLSGWRATVDAPPAVAFGELSVAKPGVWTQGPVFLQQLALLDRAWPDGTVPEGTTPAAAEYLHTVLEVTKLAMADREAWYGDPDFSPDPLPHLLSAGYTAQRLSHLGDGADRDPTPGDIPGRRPCSVVPRSPVPGEAPHWLREISYGVPNLALAATARPGDTCVIAVADRWGNLVAAVPSGGWLKSSPVIPNLGLSLGTRAQSMWLTPAAHPNAMEPGKRPRSTLSPTVVLRDGRPHLAFGTPGGDRQDQWTLLSFLAAARFGLDLQAATEVPMVHTDHFPSSFTPRRRTPNRVEVEAQLPPETVWGLRDRGHDVSVAKGNRFGRVCMVGAGGRSGFLQAGAGPRGRQAYAAGR